MKIGSQKKNVMDFFGYKATQMAVFEKKSGIEFAVIGRRKIYKKQSIIDYLEREARGRQ